MAAMSSMDPEDAVGPLRPAGQTRPMGQGVGRIKLRAVHPSLLPELYGPPNAHDIRQRRRQAPLKRGTGRAPSMKRFSIALRLPQPEDADSWETARQEEDLKAAIVYQAKRLRRSALHARLRRGTGRAHVARRCHIRLVLPEAAVEEDPEDEEAAVEVDEVVEPEPLGSVAYQDASTGPSSDAQAAATPRETPSVFTRVGGIPEWPSARLSARAKSGPGEHSASRPLSGSSLRPRAPIAAWEPGFSPLEGVPELMERNAAASVSRLRRISQKFEAAAGEQAEEAPEEDEAQASPAGAEVAQALEQPAGAEVAQALEQPAGAEVAQALEQPAGAEAAQEQELLNGAEVVQEQEQPAGSLPREPEPSAACSPRLSHGDGDQGGFGGYEDGGYDDGGYEDGGYDDGCDEPSPGIADSAEEAEHVPAPRAATPLLFSAATPAAARKPRARPARRGKRDELGKRKSLGTAPNVGRQEVAPGIRRSSRVPMRPLKWWLNESKLYSRAEHQTMPTVTAVIHRSPSTPWKTVEDPFPRRKKLREAARGGKGKEARLAQEGLREGPSPGRWDDESD